MMLANDEFREFLIRWSARAVEYLYQRHFRGLVRASYFRTHDRKASEDIVQETFAHFWIKHPSLIKETTLPVGSILYNPVITRSMTWFTTKREVLVH